MNKETPKKITVFLLLTILLAASSTSYVPNTMAAPSITSLLPISGHVGDTVAVTGTIDTTNGTFTIRWDGAINVTTSKAVNTEVNTTFVVPATAASPSGRDINVELIDNNASTVASAYFTLYTQFSMRVDKPSSPKQLQEGNTTSIRVNVTGGPPNTVYTANITVKNPANQTHIPSIMLSLPNTTVTGSAGGAKAYPTDFNGAHTNLTGTYSAAFNSTLATAEFFVGLTDKTEYRRNENVQVQAAGYKPSEKVNVDIRTAASVSGFPKNFTASQSGLVTLTWKVPVNATPGTYHTLFTNTTVNGTVKARTDAQDFTVFGFVCSVQARNLANEAVESALVEAYNASATATALSKGNTDSSGWIRFNLDGGNYTFKAFLKNVQVGLLANEVIMADKELHMQLSLVNFVARAKTEEGEVVPLIDVALRFNYTARDNKTTTETALAQTNASGMAALRNLFTNRTYRVEARRYGLLFNSTTVYVYPLPLLPISLNLTLPTHSLRIHAIDAKDRDAAEVGIRAYEWASGFAAVVESNETSSNGDTSFSLPFGKYVLRAFKGEDFLSEMLVDLDEPLSITFDLVTLKVDVTVSVLDFFGQPVANAEVRIERKIGQNFELISTQMTNSAGSAQFAEIVGGESRVSVYVGGTLVAVGTQFLGAGSNDMALKVAEYVAVLGYLISTGAFALIIFILALLVIVLIAARKRVIQLLRRSSKR